MALGVLKRDFLSLQDRCRATVLAHLTHEEQIDQLKLPLRIKHFISEGLENFQVTKPQLIFFWIFSLNRRLSRLSVCFAIPCIPWGMSKSSKLFLGWADDDDDDDDDDDVKDV